MNDDKAKIAIAIGLLWLLLRPPGMSNVNLTWTDPVTGEVKPIGSSQNPETNAEDWINI